MLSKSLYIKGLQCEKYLWLSKHKPELLNKNDSHTESLFKIGDTVGELAKSLFPNGIEIEFDSSDFKSMLAKTSALIEKKTSVIYEATFSHDGMLVMADILVKNGEGWDIYEVKGSTQVKSGHIDDLSFQWDIISKILKLKNAFIVHINKKYRRDGELNVKELFNIDDVTGRVVSEQAKVAGNIIKFSNLIDKDEPDVDIGTHCSSPYVCSFKKHCWKNVPNVSVLNLYRMNKQTRFELFNKGIVKLSEIPSEVRLSKKQKVQIESVSTNKPIINIEAIQLFVDQVEYPINFFDFETFQNAIPRFDNQRPYQQMPFQYSLHILHKNGRLEHKEYLGDENKDPRIELAERMLKDITAKGTIIAFFQGFEKGQIKGLAKLCPKTEDALLALKERFIDLLVPFQKTDYYHPDFNGSFSIKSILPAIFPDDDELDYKKLNIQNGGMAMDTFAKLYLLKDESKKETIRKDLLAYCRLDTLAMVRLWEFLLILVNEE